MRRGAERKKETKRERGKKRNGARRAARMRRDAGGKTRGGCELLVFYCSSGVICGVVVLSYERRAALPSRGALHSVA